MKQFALFVTTKQSACNFSGPPQEGPEKNFFRSLRSRTRPPINIFVILTLYGIMIRHCWTAVIKLDDETISGKLLFFCLGTVTCNLWALELMLKRCRIFRRKRLLYWLHDLYISFVSQYVSLLIVWLENWFVNWLTDRRCSAGVCSTCWRWGDVTNQTRWTWFNVCRKPTRLPSCHRSS